MMKISKKLANTLQQLFDGESVAASSLRKDFAETLLLEGLLTVQTHGSRRTFRAIDTEQAAETGNSKLVMVRSCPGFPVNSYEPITCSLSRNEFVINPPEGSFVFIDNWQQFAIPEGVIVVGIENMENFRMIRQQRSLFKSFWGDNPLLFVSRYPQSTDLRNWLMGISNKYVHFGDFDLAGIHIFLTEFYKYIGNRSEFLVPSDIEQRLAKGSPVRYNKQYGKYCTLRTDIQYLQFLIDLINKYHRGYDQEGYID